MPAAMVAWSIEWREGNVSFGRRLPIAEKRHPYKQIEVTPIDKSNLSML